MKIKFVKKSIRLIIFAVIFISAVFLSKSTVFASDVVINEILPNPPSGEKEWIEFYNTTETPIDLSNYYFDDDDILLVDGQIQKGTSDPGSDPQELSGILPSKSTCFLDLTSYLNNDKDKPTLFLLNGIVVDSYEYSDSMQNESFSRIPDGTDWQSNQAPTKSNTQCFSLAPTPTSPPIPTFTPTPTLKSTPTLKPAPTSKSTSTPKPTATPKPTPTTKPTPTSKISTSPSKIVLAGNSEKTSGSNNSESGSHNLPKEILGENIKNTDAISSSPSITNEPSPKKEVKVLSSVQNNISGIFFGLGSIFLLACGILAYHAYKKGELR
ncbi:MAG: lamin tail domain-containing protein [Candidatus Levybacteria bacterium]|nr:lamin tail domain-containing protein [Candidatus Levybacteria bacterium]